MQWRVLTPIVVGFCALIIAGSAFGADNPVNQLQEADKLFGLNRYEQAEQAYLGIVQEGGAEAFVALRQLCCLYVITADQAKADLAYESLLTLFSNQPTLAKQISLVGDAYVKVGKFDKASGLYQYIVDNWPGSEHLLWAKTGFAKIDIEKESDALATEKIEAFVTDFNDHPDLAQAVFSVAEAYWYKSHAKFGEGFVEQQQKYLRKALGQWQRIINDLPKPEAVLADSYYYCGDCYRLLNERINAIGMYEDVVKIYPDAECAPYAQFLIGQSYSQLWLAYPKANSDILAKSKAAYQKVIDNYPNTRIAKLAAKGLKHTDR